MRIVGGEFKGAKLAAPSGQVTRPTSDRVRESLFNILLHGVPGFDIEGARVLDLFAGTGALGLEALSRGARWCVFIEEDAKVRGVIRQNIEALDLTGRTKVWRRDASKLSEAGKDGGFDLVFADPPYGKGLGQKALSSAYAGGWVTADGVFVLEEREGETIEPPHGVTLIDQRLYGDTQILFFQGG